jgi:hypothetical protein
MKKEIDFMRSKFKSLSKTKGKSITNGDFLSYLFLFKVSIVITRLRRIKETGTPLRQCTALPDDLTKYPKYRPFYRPLM